MRRITERDGGRATRFQGKARWIAPLVLLFASVVFSLVLSEGLVRLFAPQSLILLRPDIWIPAEHIGWRLKPNVDTRVDTGERQVRWKTDDQGFRIGESQPHASDMTLVALGDSFVAAMQVEYEDTMTSRLEGFLAGRCGKSIRILNTGVDGWDPNQYRIELKRILANRSVDGVLVFVYLGNDIVQQRVESYAPKQPAKRHVPEFPKRLDYSWFIGSVAYPINDFLEVRSHLFIFLKNRFMYALMRAQLTAYFFPDSLLVSQAKSKRWGATAGILQEIAVMAEEQGLKTMFILIPSPEEANLEEGRRTAEAFGVRPGTFDLDQAHLLLGAEMARRNLTVVDTTSVLRAAIDGRDPDVYGKVDNHLGKRGHQVVAETMEDSASRMFCTESAAGKTF